MSIKSFPKIFAIGTDYIKDIFLEEIEITEKVDGSQFVFGRVSGELYARSKGAPLYFDNPNKMFAQALDYVSSIAHLIPDNTIFYCEYLQKPKHNTLVYGRIPKNHLMLFGVSDTTDAFKSNLEEYASLLDIEHVPVVYRGFIKEPQEIFDLIKNKSVLGEADMEGIVVKNYQRPFLLGGQPIPLMAGKYVSETFKEKHKVGWEGQKTKGRISLFLDSFKTEARWQKAIQHLKEKGEIENSPKDIGKLMKEISVDIIAEEKEAIKDFLWGEYKGELARTATRGFPEWYKKKLVEDSFTS